MGCLFCSNCDRWDIQWQCEVKQAMDEYYHLISALPEPFSEELGKLPDSIAPAVQEIRFRVGQPVLFTVKGKLVKCTDYLPTCRHSAWIGAETLQRCFLHLCHHSAYAYEEELAQGFFTIPGGNRVGVAGTKVQAHFSSITSLNLRVARWVTCHLSTKICQYLSAEKGGLLVAGAPGSGKTTFLRTLVQYLGQTDTIVCVVDERGELMAGGENRLPDMQCDVYTRCTKAEGIDMALRCMNPRFIVCDELGTAKDAAAVEQGIASGALFVASIHCDSPQMLEKRPQLVRLLETGAFSAAIFLAGRTRPGTVAQWVTLS